MTRTPILLLSSIFVFLLSLFPGQARAGGSLAEKLKRKAEQTAKDMRNVPEPAREQVANVRKDAQQQTRQVRQEARAEVRGIANETKEAVQAARESARGGTEEAKEEARQAARQAVHDGREAAQAAIAEASKKVEEIKKEARDQAREAIEAAGGTVGGHGHHGGKHDDDDDGDGKGDGPTVQSVQSAATVGQTVSNIMSPVAAAGLLEGVAAPAIPGIKDPGLAPGGAPPDPAAALPKTTPLSSLPTVSGFRDAADRPVTEFAPSARLQAPLDRLPSLPEERPVVGLDLGKKVAIQQEAPAPPADAKRYALVRSAKTFAHMGEYRKAIESATEALNENPGDAEALLTRAEALLRRGDADAAALDAEAAVKANPSSVQALVVWADALRKTGSREAALKIIERALRLSSKDATLWLRRAALQDELGDRTNAMASLARAAEINPRLDKLYQAAERGGRIRYPEFDEDLTGGDLPSGSRGFGLLGWLLAGGCLASLGGALWLGRRRKASWVEDIAAGAPRLAATQAKPLSFADKYERVRALSSGADGEVLLFKDTSLEREVAVRRLPSGGDKERRARAAEAARAAGSILHRAFVDVYEVAEDGDDVCVVSEVVSGKTAAELIAQAGRLPLAQAVRVLEPACEALEAAHDKGVAHRRLSPRCVFITDQGRTKITGLGVGQASVPFGEDGRRADVHGLAVCLYEMTTGAKPFGASAADGLAGRSPAVPALAGAIEVDGRAGLDYVPPSQRHADLPPELDALLQDALAPTPTPVIPTAADFLARLKGLESPVAGAR